MSEPINRYRRQIRFAPFGEAGQRELNKARVLIVGCGALGCVSADLLVRAGVGFVRLVDRDFVERDNLHRQVLFTESDAAEQLPKAVAGANRLKSVNSEVVIEPVVADVNANNLRSLAADVEVIVDGTDNFETRYLINDFAVENNLPWVFAGCVGAEGQTMAIVPGQTPCLSCFLPEPPPAASMPTCETAGVLAPIVSVVSAYQAMEAIKLLSGNAEAINPQLTVFDMWNNHVRSINMLQSRRADCPTCGQRHFLWLTGERGSAITKLCGRNSVQISPPLGERVDLAVLADKLELVGSVTKNPFLVRVAVDEFLITVFADGRAMVGGTEDEATARTVLAKYVGS
jgi:molybdopterin/thiamine biosynthesis adenylyltransferase